MKPWQSKGQSIPVITRLTIAKQVRTEDPVSSALGGFDLITPQLLEALGATVGDLGEDAPADIAKIIEGLARKKA